MSTLHVLLPPLARLTGNQALRDWIARGDRLPDSEGARSSALRALFRFAGGTVPVAALRHSCHAEEARSGAWLCADPAYVRSEATGARLMAWPLHDLSPAEARGLSSTLRPMFGDAGTPLAVDTPSAWCLHLPGGAPPAEFTAPSDALGVDMLECLPQGQAGRPWRRLFNDAQVALHAHPVNAARVAAGKLPVNALWFWGAGPLPEPVEASVQRVASRDDVLQGLAKAAGLACVDPVPATLDAGDPDCDVLLDLDRPTATGDMAGWHACFRRWLRTRRFDAIELTLADGHRFRVRHVHRLRFWRR